ncbi:MAG: glycine--tRNA ligase subunit beta [Thermodesulfobacteriota bacterium]
MQHELLLEIGTEEIPASYIDPALAHLKKGMEKKLGELSLPFSAIRTAATPRRLTISVSDLAQRQEDQSKEVMGPPKQAGFDADNKPTKAAIGFAKSRGASVDDIQVVSTDKGDYLMVVQEIKGQDTSALLQDFLPELILSTPFPKSMRWADKATHFARPLQWLLALFGGQTLSFKIDDHQSGNTTRGHRFMSPETREITDFKQYQEALLDMDVLVDIDKRRGLIESQVKEAASASGGSVVLDLDLLDTVTQLVELPNAIGGSFDDKFLELPKEVLTTSMRVNQKYFTVADKNGDLLPYFVAVNNTRVKDEAISREGHQRVLRARLEDGLFFFNEDRKRRLEEYKASLSGVVFQAQLGTMAEKNERFTSLATQLARELEPDLLETTKRASELCKADLVTDMVGEFPSLQGVMGKYYALHDGETAEVAEAIMDHYKPLRSGSALPSGKAGALVSMADRIDTMAGCFAIGKAPTGATDPYGLRRHALALIHIISDQDWHLSLSAIFSKALDQYDAKVEMNKEKTLATIINFIKGRYINDLVAAGNAAGAVEAATSGHFDDITDCRQRLAALAAISSHENFTLLAGAFKRVTNIIKDHEDREVQEKLLSEDAEQKLFAAFTKVAEECRPLLAKRDYNKALQAILKMKEPVDCFFDEVMVMAEDEAVKHNRLSLLAAIAHLFLQIGDFSKMYTLKG